MVDGDGDDVVAEREVVTVACLSVADGARGGCIGELGIGLWLDNPFLRSAKEKQK
jgi:hypothetical protein